MQDEIECGLAKRRILGDKIELPMEPASGNTVLIIEDERDVVDLLALNLRKAGFAISTAADALKRGLYHFQRRR